MFVVEHRSEVLELIIVILEAGRNCASHTHTHTRHEYEYEGKIPTVLAVLCYYYELRLSTTKKC